jgi:hypothetical protein
MTENDPRWGERCWGHVPCHGGRACWRAQPPDTLYDRDGTTARRCSPRNTPRIGSPAPCRPPFSELEPTHRKLPAATCSCSRAARIPLEAGADERFTMESEVPAKVTPRSSGSLVRSLRTARQHATTGPKSPRARETTPERALGYGPPLPRSVPTACAAGPEPFSAFAGPCVPTP